MLIQQETWITPLDEARTLHLYIPDGLTPGQKVPVLYMFDGHNLFVDEEATYGKSWGLKDYLELTRLPLVVVGLECNHEGNRRLWEFSPYDFADPVWGEVQGQGELLLDWMSGELKEWVDENLPVLTDREHTFIGGSSMGGLMALYAGGRYSSVYSRAACRRIWDWSWNRCAKILTKPGSRKTRSFISAGAAWKPAPRKNWRRSRPII